MSIAYSLSRRGAEVTVLDANEIGHGASFGNAGLVVPSYGLPLANFANAMEGLRSLLRLHSQIDVRLPLDSSSLGWIVRFLLSTRKTIVDRGLAILAGFSQRSLALYDELLADAPADVDFAKFGTMYASLSSRSQNRMVSLAGRLKRVGVSSVVFNGNEARAHEPTLSSNVVGAVWYPDDRRLQPLNFVRMLAERAVKHGTEVIKTRAVGIALEEKRARGVQTEARLIEADRVVIAAGCWSTFVARSVGLDIPMQPAKGYSFDIRLERNPRTALLFCEEHVSLTPLNDVTRATTGHDFHGYDPSIDPRRLDKIHKACKLYLEGPSIIHEGEPWSGFRPLTPDGLPIIGSSSRIENLAFATGHAGLGITLAPATGEAIAGDLLDGVAELPNEMLPGRFGL